MPNIGDKSGIADFAMSVTPTDDTNIAATGYACVGLYITTGGTLAVKYLGRESQAAHVMTVPDNFVYPMAVSRVEATGTTATGIHAMMVLD